MKTSSISKQNFKGLPVRLHFSDDHFVYVIPERIKQNGTDMGGGMWDLES